MIRQRVIQDQNGNLRAAIYARTSSQSQEYGYSLDAQIEKCVEHCQTMDWELKFIYRDEAESGKDTDRPMFQQMLQAAKKDAFDVIVFWKLDRFSRSLMHAVRLEADLRDSNVSLYSVTEQIDTTSVTGRFNFRNIASAAEFERDMIKQRTKMGLNQLASERKWPNADPPLGYDLGQDRRLVINKDEKELVKKIFENYIEKRSMPKVAEWLNDEGFTTQEDGKWTPRAVGDVLRNRIYIGQYEVGDVSEIVSEYQIISNDTFDQVTSIRRRFQRDGTASDSMSESRKARITADILEAYEEFLDSCS